VVALRTRTLVRAETTSGGVVNPLAAPPIVYEEADALCAVDLVRSPLARSRRSSEGSGIGIWERSSAEARW
jgi:hypothetical protein